MWKRITNIIKLSGKDPQFIEELSPEFIQQAPEMGDGNAVFLGEGSAEEWKEQEREDKGLKGIFGLHD